MGVAAVIQIQIQQRAVFIPHSGFASAGVSKLDQFAEHLADGLSVPEAAQRVGWASSQGNAMLQRIRKRLGPQAR